MIFSGIVGYCRHRSVHLELTVKCFMKEKLQVHRYGSHKESLALAFWKLNLAAIHKWEEWLHNHFQHVLGFREGRDLLVVEFSLVKWLKCLGCHVVMENGTHMDANLSNSAIVYSALVVVMMKIVHGQV